MVLSRGSRLLYNWLQRQIAGTIVSYDEIMQIAKWSESSLVTYIKKNKIAPFLTNIGDRQVKVVMDGVDVNEAHFDETFTQKAPRAISLSAGDRLIGADATYTLEQPIGEGAIGKVWVVKTDRNRRLAAKVMLPRTDLLQSSKMPDIRERFRKEAKYAQDFDHPNVVRYLDRGEAEKNPFLVMELAERSIADRLKRDGAIQEEEAAEIVDGCINGISYIHGRNNLHRDIKPANILEFDTTFKIGDLGVVKWSDFDPVVTHGGAITRQSVQIGSWNYVSPEQQESSHDALPSSDVYSLGVTWIEMLNGSVPAPLAIGARAYPLPALRAGIADLIHSMCAYSVGDRPTLNVVQEEIRRTYDLSK